MHTFEDVPKQVNTPLKVLVSSGGTVTPIDEIRVIANLSHGKTGSLIAESFLRHGHTLRYLGGASSYKPFSSTLTVNPQRDVDQELERLIQEAPDAVGLLKSVSFDSCRTFAEYQQKLLTALQDQPDVAVLAMAANDYAPVAINGKIRSDQEELSLHLHKLPKLISEVKRSSPKTFLVGFKHEIELPGDKVIESAYKSLLANKGDLVVANIDHRGVPRDQMRTFIVTRERGVISVNRSDLPEKLVSYIEQRRSQNHFRSLLTKVTPEQFKTREVTAFLEQLSSLSDLSLFPNYNPGDSREFGFLAKRERGDFLITSRGSSKTEATLDDVAVVSDVNLDQRTVTCSSTGRKASLNAPLAGLIFKLRPEIKYIVHSHINLSTASSTGVVTSPGTLEDCRSVEQLVLDGHQVIYQPDHGVLILMEDLKDLPTLLAQHSIYHKNPQLYDLAYHRFTRRSRLIDLFEDLVSKDGKILDMAGGTGQVSKQLRSRGYSDITIVDRSPGMLDYAKSQLQEIPDKHFVVSNMEDYRSTDLFDGIIVRQAINYLTADQLGAAFRSFKDVLAPGGKLLFNTFNSDLIPPKRVPLKRDVVGDSIVLTLEGNRVEGEVITHSQRTEIYNEKTGEYSQVYDLNSFYRHPLGVYVDKLKEGGFTEIKAVIEGSSIYVIAS